MCIDARILSYIQIPLDGSNGPLAFQDFITNNIIPSCFVAPSKPEFDLTDAQTMLVRLTGFVDLCFHVLRKIMCFWYKLRIFSIFWFHCRRYRKFLSYRKPFIKSRYGCIKSTLVLCKILMFQRLLQWLSFL